MSDASPQQLRLIALDVEDLGVLSANMQDAVVRVRDMVHLPTARRFALVASRYDWVAAQQGRMERVRAGLHFERVLRVSHIGIDQSKPDEMLNLLSIVFEPTEMPAGFVQLIFSGGSAVRVDVECLEAQMRDMGPRWTTHLQPGHAMDDAPADSE